MSDLSLSRPFEVKVSVWDKQTQTSTIDVKWLSDDLH
jgi:hypothetical protein